MMEDMTLKEERGFERRLKEEEDEEKENEHLRI